MSNPRQDYLKPAAQVICDLINKANPGRSFAPADLEFGTPTVHEIVGGDTKSRNTDLEVTVKSTDVTTTVNYGRLDLGARQGLANGAARIPFNGQVTVADCLAQINQLAGLALTADDVMNVALEGLDAESLPYDFILTAKSTSLIVIGTVPVQIYDEEADDGDGDGGTSDPEPDPDPGVMSFEGLSVDQAEAAPGEVVTISVDLAVAGEAASDGSYRLDFAMTGMTFTAPGDIPMDQGITLLGQAGADEATIMIAPGTDVGTYTVSFTATIDEAAVEEATVEVTHDIGGEGQTDSFTITVTEAG